MAIQGWKRGIEGAWTAHATARPRPANISFVHIGHELFTDSVDIPVRAACDAGGVNHGVYHGPTTTERVSLRKDTATPDPRR